MNEIEATLVAGFIPTLLVAILARIWSLKQKKKEDVASIRVATIESATDILPTMVARLEHVEGELVQTRKEAREAQERAIVAEERSERADKRNEFITELVLVLVKQNVDLIVGALGTEITDDERKKRFEDILHSAAQTARNHLGHDGGGFAIIQVLAKSA